MRYLNYYELKAQIHEEGISVKQISKYMHISPSALRNKLAKEVDNDFIDLMNFAIKEARAENVYRVKIGMPMHKFRVS